MAINANSHPYKVVVGDGTSPIYANRHPIKVEIEGGVVTPAEFEELEAKVDALATDLTYKGSVPTYNDLPETADDGDTYLVEDTGVIYTWADNRFIPLNDTKSNTIVETSAPTTSTEGEVGQFYVDTTAGKVYVLTSISGDTYNWDLVGPTVVQSTGQSTTSVMSQKAVTDALASAGVHTITTSDYNWNTNTHSTTNPNSIALWLLPEGLYKVTQGSPNPKIWSYRYGSAGREQYAEGGYWYVNREVQGQDTTKALVFFGETGILLQQSVERVGKVTLVKVPTGEYINSGISPDELDVSTDYIGVLATLDDLKYCAKDENYTTSTALAAGTKGLVPAPGVGAKKKVLTDSAGWDLRQSDYEQNDNTMGDYVKNRPFYEYTTTSSQSLIDNTGFSHGGGVAPIDSSEYPPSAIMDDLTNRGISFGSYEPGAFWWSVSSATKQNILDAIDNGDDVVFSHIGGNWEDWEHEASGTVDLTFEVSSVTELSNGEYAFDGTLKNSGTTISGAVVYLTDSSNWGRDFEDQTQGWSPYYGDLLAIFAQNLSWNVGYGSNTLPNIDNPWEWHIDSNSEVTVTKKLDSKFIKVDGDTISVNSDGELEAQVSGGIKTLTSADYDWPTVNPNGVALWKLEAGAYKAGAGVKVHINTSNSETVQTGKVGLILASDSMRSVGSLTDKTIMLVSGFKNFSIYATSSNGSNQSSTITSGAANEVLISGMMTDSLTDDSSYKVGSSKAITSLNSKIEGRVIQNAGAPTTSTVGTVGVLLEDTTNGKLYQCTAVNGSTYTWEEVGGGSGITELTTADYDYPTDNPRMVAVWKLPTGVYHAAKNIAFAVGISIQNNRPLEVDTSTSSSGSRITVQTSDDAQDVAITVTGFHDTVVQGSSYIVGSLAFAVRKDTGYGEYYQFRDGALIPIQKLDEVYATNRIFSSSASGLVPAGGPSSSKRVLLNNGWAIWPQSDYSQSTDTSLDYIKNRPFYEDSTTVSTRINHDPSSSSEWLNEGAQYSIDPSLSSSLSTLAVSVGAENPTGGEVYVGLQDSEYDDMVSAVANNANFSFSMTGKMFDMMSGDENVIVLSFSGEAFALDATTGLYAATVTLYESWNQGTPYPHQNVLVVFGAKNDVDTRYAGTTNYLFAVLAPFSDEYFVTGQWDYGGTGEWANISTVQTVTTLKQLDAKYVPIDNSTITTNAQGKLVASGGPTVVQATGTSTTDVMSQNAVTKALAGAGGIKTLTTADYNYPAGNPDGVTLWNKNPGVYLISAGTKAYAAANDSFSVSATDGSMAIAFVTKSGTNTPNYCVEYINSGAHIQTGGINAVGNYGYRKTLPIGTSNPLEGRTDFALSAAAGYTLQQSIGSLNSLTTTAKTSAVAAINELDSDKEGKTITDSAAPTTATVADNIGQKYYDSTNDKWYVCKAITPGVDPDPTTYTWVEQAGGPTVVQTTGSSTTDVMSQNAVTTALGNVLVNGGTTVPTSSTEGQVGTQYNCVNNGEPEIYICTAVDTSTTPNIYTWKKVGLTLQLSTTDPGEGSPLADNTLLGIYE